MHHHDMYGMHRVHGAHGSYRMHGLYGSMSWVHRGIHQMRWVHRVCRLYRMHRCNKVFTARSFAKKAPGMLRKATELIVVKGSEDDAVVASSRALRPLYVMKGASEVLRWLSLIPAEGFDEAWLPDCLRPIVQSLVMHEILVRQNTSERSGDDGRSNAAHRPGLSLYLLLTHRCNLRCTYCLNGERSYQLNNPPSMSLGVALAAGERYLSMLSPGGQLEVVFFGGEPLLNWRLCSAIVAEFNSRLRPKWPDREIRYHLTSNLSTCPDDLPRWAAKNNVSVLCDVDGDEAVHDAMRPTVSGKGSHKRVKRTIRKLLDAGAPVALRATVTSQNVKLIPEISEHHRELGAHASAFVAVAPVNSDEEILPDHLLPEPTEFVDGISSVLRAGTWPLESLFPANEYAGRLGRGEMLRFGCGAPYGNTPIVDALGNIYPCHYLVGIERFRTGNAFDRDRHREKQVLEGLLKRLDVEQITTCHGCLWRYLCGGGCPVMRLMVRDNPRASERARKYANDIVCAAARHIGAAVLWHAAKRAKESLEKRRQGLSRVAPVAPVVCAP